MTRLDQLPPDLPPPLDDGAARHLVGTRLPSVTLPSTGGPPVALDHLAGTGVIYIYPMTGRPGVALPDGWDAIPGARGCTPQSCAYRDHLQEIKALGATWVFGLSTQSSDYQKEMAERLHLPFAVLSDAEGHLGRQLNLPTFDVAGMTLLKRLTLIVIQGEIRAVHYPVFPSDQDPQWVMTTLQAL